MSSFVNGKSKAITENSSSVNNFTQCVLIFPLMLLFLLQISNNDPFIGAFYASFSMTRVNATIHEKVRATIHTACLLDIHLYFTPLG
jgi:hypothetical protein